MGTRRNFLLGSLTAVITAALKPTGLLAADILRSGLDQRLSLNRANLLGLLQTRFQIIDEKANQLDSTLVEVKEGPDTAKLEQFTAVFQGSGATKINPGLYGISHSKLGNFMLPLEPLTGNQQAHVFKAVFCHFS